MYPSRLNIHWRQKHCSATQLWTSCKSVKLKILSFIHSGKQKELFVLESNAHKKHTIHRSKKECCEHWNGFRGSWRNLKYHCKMKLWWLTLDDVTDCRGCQPALRYSWRADPVQFPDFSRPAEGKLVEMWGEGQWLWWSFKAKTDYWSVRSPTLCRTD